ncbi:MAG TPA: RsmE family RNA methyltransferase, partial [Mesotoga sp.]|nr:RsmE family RNA methyltransferase [Mesotoga sp.]
VGPEGGFTQKEIAQLTDHCTSISLGSRTLRVETGVIVILSIINYFLGRI